VNREALLKIIVPGTDPDVVDSYCSYAERAESTAFGFEEEVCVLDVETTGYDPSRDQLIEVAASIMRGPEILDRFESLVDPLVPIPDEITRLTGIGSEMVAGAPCAESVVTQLVQFAAGRPLLAHNVSFDRSFLERVAGKGAFGPVWALRGVESGARGYLGARSWASGKDRLSGSRRSLAGALRAVASGGLAARSGSRPQGASAAARRS